MDGIAIVGVAGTFALWMVLRRISSLHAEIVNARAQMERFEAKMDRQFDHISDRMGRLGRDWVQSRGGRFAEMVRPKVAAEALSWRLCPVSAEVEARARELTR